MSPAAKDIDSYLAALPVEHRAALQKVRETIKAAAPDAAESISYGIPTFKYKGQPLIYFGGAKNHCALYGSLGSVIAAHKKELQPYVTSKGTIRFSPEKPIPAGLVKRLVKAQMKDIEAGAGAYRKFSRKDTNSAQETDAPTTPELAALLIERVFDAPRELVWRAWTDPEHVKHWWGPKGFTSPACEVDLRVGGTYLWAMRSPEGWDIWSTGVYREIVPLTRIACTKSFADENGNIVPASHYGIAAALLVEMLATVTFEDLGTKTKLTLRREGMSDGEMSEMDEEGWNESFDKLAGSLKHGR